jgi:polyadenylate-binding protein
MAAAGNVPQFASLYVGDLHADVTEAMLYEIFNSVGPVGSIRVCRDSVTRRSLGYGYVNFHAVADAERALDTLNYSSIKGRACRIMWSQRDPTLRKSGVGNIYVSNLDRSIDNKALYDTFSLFGNILSCKVATDPDGKSLGYGFVHYETEEAGKQSIERVNGMQIGDKTVHVSSFLKRSDREPKTISVYTNLYIKGIPQDWDEEKVSETFGTYGEITSTCVMESKGRKFAFVNFKESDAAIKCVEEMHGKDLRTDEEKKAAEESEEKEDDPQGILYVQRAQSKAERAREFKAKMAPPDTGSKAPQGVNLYVKNLDESIDDESLKALFDTFGTITSAKAMIDEKGKCKGFGFVCFASPDDATKAVTEMHLKVVSGKPLYVGLAEKREVRADRLASRYNVGKGGKGGSKGGKGMSQMGGKGMPQMGGMMGGPQMGGMMGGMGGGMMGGPQMGGMMGKGPMMGSPQMGGKGGPMMGMGGPMGGARPMMGGPPQMMMGNPQMMQMMQQKGQMPGGQMQQMMMGKGGMPGGPMPGMMRPMMPPQMQGGVRPMGGPQGPPAQPQAPQPTLTGGQPLNAAVLAAAPPAVQKQMIGEK